MVAGFIWEGGSCGRAILIEAFANLARARSSDT
jgi:hypothetical protein